MSGLGARQRAILASLDSGGGVMRSDPADYPAVSRLIRRGYPLSLGLNRHGVMFLGRLGGTL